MSNPIDGDVLTIDHSQRWRPLIGGQFRYKWAPPTAGGSFPLGINHGFRNQTNFHTDRLIMQQVTLHREANIINLRAMIKQCNGVAVCKMALYDGLGGGGVLGLEMTPGALIIATTPQVCVVGWNDFVVDPILCPPGNYWIALQVNDSGVDGSGSDSDIGWKCFWDQDYGDFPDPAPTADLQQNGCFAMYAVFQ